MSKAMKNLMVAGTIVGLPAFAITALQIFKAVLPWHALVTALLMAALLLVQFCVPWRHRHWNDEDLAEVKNMMLFTNNTLFVVFLVIAVVVLLAGYIWQQAPGWIEGRLQHTVPSRHIDPIATVGQPTPLVSAKLPEVSLAQLPSEQPTDPPGDLTHRVCLYPVDGAIAAAIGTTRKLSDYAAFGILVQLLFVMFLAISERIAEVVVKNKPKGASP